MASVSGHTALSIMSLLFTKTEFPWKEDCLRMRREGGGMGEVGERGLKAEEFWKEDQLGWEIWREDYQEGGLEGGR